MVGWVDTVSPLLCFHGLDGTVVSKYVEPYSTGGLIAGESN
jgi:hypothetical protein